MEVAKNKENISRNANISSIFKVKKCLFDQAPPSNKKETTNSLSSGQQSQTCSPVSKPLFQQDSPYSLFKIRKKKSLHKAVSFSQIVPTDSSDTTPNKKFAKLEIVEKEEICEYTSQSPNNVKLAIQKSILNPNLIGDFTKPCALQTIKGRHPDLKTVSPETVASLMAESKILNFTLVDCRYPYEYNAGHIKNALNIFIKEDIVKLLLNDTDTLEKKEAKEALIFYCEFSSERGPSMLRHLRSTDRDMNKDCYPFLHYPELYVMEGGYKAFFSAYKEFCQPPEYKTMLDEDCSEELAYYRSKCKSTSRRTKCLKRTRSTLQF